MLISINSFNRLVSVMETILFTLWWDTSLHMCIPRSVMHLAVTNGSKALEIQHMVSLIMEKITIFFGYKAVYGIKIKQESIDYFAV